MTLAAPPARLVAANTELAAADDDASDRLRRITTPEAMPVELVSAFGGDRELTEDERDLIAMHEANRGVSFFSDLLYAISHHYFAPEIAENLWHEIIAHKRRISELLGRDVRVAVATLDYLSNIKTGLLRSPTVVSEADISLLANLSMRDGMTGLFNHTSCYELLELEFRNHRRHGVGVSLLLLDIDDFKSINDRRGHPEGDRVLVALAGTLEEQTRDSDVCCRIGGDEFVVILPVTNNPEDAYEIAERVRAGATAITSSGRAITVSVGVALCDDGVTSPRALLERADGAMYQAKVGGKNRVVVSGEQSAWAGSVG